MYSGSRHGGERNHSAGLMPTREQFREETKTGLNFASELNIIVVLYVKAIIEIEVSLIFSLLDILSLPP